MGFYTLLVKGLWKMKCWAILVNRNRAKLYKKGSYEACSGKIHKGFRENLAFFIPDNSIPLEVEKGRRGSIPLWIVNEKTLMALSLTSKTENLTVQGENDPKELITLEEKTDVNAHTKMNLLSKREFWKQVAEKIKLSKIETFIYLCAGYGLIRIIEYFLMLVFQAH